MSAAEIEKAATETLTAYATTEQSYADGGEYLPLEVWGTRGFNIENIRSKSQAADIREDRVLGTCYRVRIVSSYVNTRAGNVRESRLFKKPKMTLALGSGGLDHGPLAIEDGDVGDDGSGDDDSNKSSNTSYSNSSSSRDRRRRRKDKKSKKHKKAKSRSRKEKRKKERKNKDGVLFSFYCHREP